MCVTGRLRTEAAKSEVVEGGRLDGFVVAGQCSTAKLISLPRKTAA